MLEGTIHYEKTDHSHFRIFSACHALCLLRVKRSRNDDNARDYCDSSICTVHYDDHNNSPGGWWLLSERVYQGKALAVASAGGG
jgi:hypothetical protein